MTTAAHLWAIGYDDVRRAERTREEIARLSEKHSLVVYDTAIAVLYADGSVTIDAEPSVVARNIRGSTLASLLACLALGAAPLTSAGVGVLLRRTGQAGSAAAAISDDFVSEVEEMMKPGTSALFVLDQEGDLDAILQGLRGLGGTVLKTTVDLARATLIQSTLAAAPTDDGSRRGPQCKSTGQ